MTGKEKATAPVLSVGADGKQPLSKSNKKSIAELPPKGNLQATESCPVESEKMQNKDELQTVSMTELYDTVYPPKIPIVDGLIYAGTYLFVGAPKVGKSFFMAQLGYHVSMGLDLWDYPVRKGTVLYLALEDDYARLQKRLSRMFGMESSENFYFATQSKNLNEGLEEQLKQFVKEHTDARLIIIDICTVVMGVCTLGIGLLWCIPIRKKILNRIDRREPVSNGLKIAATWVGMIPGLLLLVNEDI